MTFAFRRYTNVSVAINASAPNVAGASQVLMVTDLGLPTITVNNVTAPATAFTGEPFTVSFQLLNQGPPARSSVR